MCCPSRHNVENLHILFLRLNPASSGPRGSRIKTLKISRTVTKAFFQWSFVIN